MPEPTTEPAGSPTDTADPSTGGAAAAPEATAVDVVAVDVVAVDVVVEEPLVPDVPSGAVDDSVEDGAVEPADQPTAESPATGSETDQVAVAEVAVAEIEGADVEGADVDGADVDGAEVQADEPVDGPGAVIEESVSESVDEFDDEPDDEFDDDAEPASRAHRRTTIMVLLAIVVLAVDQISKSLVVAKLTGHDPVKVAGGAVYLLEVTNKGAAFNLGEGYTALFTAVAALVVVVMVRVSSRLRSTGWAVALGLILGGAAGNLSDRLFRAPGPLRGAVVDWISLFDPEGRIWPVFNLADSAIVCGGVGAVILMLLGRDLTVQSRRD